MSAPRWPVLKVAVPPWEYPRVLEAAKIAGKPVSKWCREAIEAALPVEAVPDATAPVPASTESSEEVGRPWIAVHTFLKTAGGPLRYRELKARLEDLGHKGVETLLLKGEVPQGIVREQRDDGVWFTLASNLS